MSLTELALLDGRRPLPLGDVIGLNLTLTLTFFFLLGKWEVESILGPRVTAATPGLLYLSRVIVRMEKFVE
jgi:hypothetical protein